MNSEAPNELRYYKLNALTKELDSMARYEAQVKNIMRNMSARDPGNLDLPELIAKAAQLSLDKELKRDAWTKDDEKRKRDAWTKVGEVLYSSLDGEREHNAWMSEDVTLRDLVTCIYTQNADALLVFARAAKHYADLYRDFRNVRKAQLYVIKACNHLSELGYDRSHVTLGQIKTYAEIFWRRANGAPLPKVRWPDIFKSLGLDDLPQIPSGRPPKNLPERVVPGFAPKHPKRRPRGRSSKEFGGKRRPKLRKLDNVTPYTHFERQNVIWQNMIRKRASQDSPAHEQLWLF